MKESEWTGKNSENDNLQIQSPNPNNNFQQNPNQQEDLQDSNNETRLLLNKISNSYLLPSKPEPFPTITTSTSLQVSDIVEL
ncbi:5880_t:CDS:1, partial [Entrophospora sp. SA101]